MSEEIQQNNQEYGADQIQILEGLEAVRKRPECTLEVPLPEVYIISYTKL